MSRSEAARTSAARRAAALGARVVEPAHARGVDLAGRDQVDGDALGAELLGERLDEPVDARAGRRWRSRGRGSVALIEDEAIETMRPCSRPRGAAARRARRARPTAAPTRTRAARPRRRSREQRARGRPAGVGDAGCRGRRTRRRPPRRAAAGPLGRAEVDAATPATWAPWPASRLRLLDGARELVVVAPAHHHVHALARERAGDRLADAVTGGHHGRAAADEIEIHGRDATRAQAPR